MSRALIWLHGRVRTPPFSAAARVETGERLRQLQDGETLSFPHSRPMPSIGHRCHELRIVDEDKSWRIVYRLDPNEIVIAEVFNKTTRETPGYIIETCRRRFRHYDM